MTDKVTDRPPMNPNLSEDWFCDCCGEPSGESDDDMVIDFWEPNAQKHKMAHVDCGEAVGWHRA